MLLSCGVGEDSWEDSWESLGLQPVNPKGNQSWIFIGKTDAKAETQILWPLDAKSRLITKDPDKRPWERLKAGGKENYRGWDGWMASPTRTWVWASCGRWWRTGKPRVLQSMGSQRVRHNWVTEQERKIQSKSVKVSVAQSCPTLCETMGCSPPECSVHRFSQAKILEWTAIPFSRGSSWPRDWTWASCIADSLPSEPPGKLKGPKPHGKAKQVMKGTQEEGNRWGCPG